MIMKIIKLKCVLVEWVVKGGWEMEPMNMLRCLIFVILIEILLKVKLDASMRAKLWR